MTDILFIVLFLLWVNGLPPLMAVLCKNRWSWPVDGGWLWFDGQRIFGRNKTVRGVLASILFGSLAYPLLGLSPWHAALTAALAMLGDLLTSFTKRRFPLQSGAEAVVLDQFLEALLPVIFLYYQKSFPTLYIPVIMLLFISIAYCSSQLWQHITMRPPPPKYPRVVKSSVRYREWKACHTPLAKWHVWFNLTTFLSDQILLTLLFKVTGLYKIGMRNALQINVEEKTWYFSTLPKEFDGFRILLLTDLHMDGQEEITEKIIEIVGNIEADLCLVGGDIRMKTYGDSSLCIQYAEKLMQNVNTVHGTFGVLGNHDCIEMLPELEDAGIIMLVNDSVPITINDTHIWIMGVDDPHYYQLADAQKAAEHVPENAFSIFLAHSPEAFKSAADINTNLYLCGHTHGGQICLNDGTPIITNSRAPRYTASGCWNYKTMQGYTSRGVAPSSIPVRFNCPGEITLITLKYADIINTGT
ncbi:CDP-archaeol synthase [Desulfogranum japonicum]|uniref:CDP-archaeol synthase n=1 Tax=Desulfogranum japonicum TaxID=231447 RepID=UPI00048B8895|nr:CDP-archaeol synthase [Desulfogranum japonicum]